MTDSGNLDHWEQLASFHGTGDDTCYDIPALVSGDIGLRELEQSAIDRVTSGAGVNGLRVAHVQSHIGIDSIHLARLGASVTAFDFSPTALSRLRDLAGMCSVDVPTVVADAQELESPAFAPWHGTFDLVYATVGVTCWIADLDAWMRGAAALLKGGGQLVLIDLHPLYCMVESLDPLVVDFPYVNDGVRHLEGTGSYANPNAALTWSTDQFAWSIGEIVNAAIAAGLAVAFLDEHDASPYDRKGDVLAGEGDGMYRLRIGSGVDGRPAEPLPIMFTLVVRKSSSAENS